MLLVEKRVNCVGFTGAGEEICPSTHFRCANKYQCIEMVYVMDGIEDCIDGSDESIQFSGCLTRSNFQTTLYQHSVPVDSTPFF